MQHNNCADGSLCCLQEPWHYFCKFPGGQLGLPLSKPHCKAAPSVRLFRMQKHVSLLVWTMRNILCIPCIIYVGYLLQQYLFIWSFHLQVLATFQTAALQSFSNGYLFSQNICPSGSYYSMQTNSDRIFVPLLLLTFFLYEVVIQNPKNWLIILELLSIIN